MPVRRTFGRQESIDSTRPLIARHGREEEESDASSTNLIAAGNGHSSSNSLLTRTGSTNSSERPPTFSRPMAVVNIDDEGDEETSRGRPKRLPHRHQERQRSEKQQTSEAGGAKIDDANRASSKPRLVRKSASAVAEAKVRTQTPKDSPRPLNKRSSSGRQLRFGGDDEYGSRIARAFTRRSGFQLIFDEFAGGGGVDSRNALDSDIQRFEQLYRRLQRRLRRERRDPNSDSTDDEDDDSDAMSEDEEHKPTTCREAFLGRRARKWAFWFIVAFLAALTIKDVAELVTEYSADPTQSDINVVFNETMTMPNITFCMGRTQAYSHFNLSADDKWDSIIDEQLAKLNDHDSFLKEKWDYRMTVEGYEVIASLSSLERETESAHGAVHAITKFRTMPRLEAKRKMIKKWLGVLEERNVTFEEYVQKVGVEVIRPSMQRFQRLTFDDDRPTLPTKFRTSWISEQQFCFQPWSADAAYMEIEDQGRFFTLSLSHNGDNLNNKTVNCMTVDFHGRPSSLNRFMEGKGRTRDGFDDELCMGQYHEVVVEVRALYEMLENDDNGTKCREQKDDQDTEFDCKSRCRMEMLREWCHCTPLTLGYLMKDPEEELKKFPHCDYTKCVLDVQARNYTDAECQKKCYRDCRQIRFTINHKTQGRLLRPDMTVLELHWGSFEFLSMKQDWVWSVTTFIAALGGSIGMWLGLSILSLIQGSSYLYSYLTDNVIKKKIQKQKVSVAPSEDVLPEKKEHVIAANPFENPFKPKMSRQQASTPPPAYGDDSKKSTATSVHIE